ncbi:uncharacterized protein B0T15DRAFT_284316 [Chaetomium strumarium]|uniref:Uncharacterized protein n=1 Tax=Chaetomium strumarium TaxID=1170767 RepID=A0AAJ0LZV1_9PEZI|nr:hypothetical protein B0T15DRAFT_284316 [Chaetomium strumarium]
MPNLVTTCSCPAQCRLWTMSQARYHTHVGGYRTANELCHIPSHEFTWPRLPWTATNCPTIPHAHTLCRNRPGVGIQSPGAGWSPVTTLKTPTTRQLVKLLTWPNGRGWRHVVLLSPSNARVLDMNPWGDRTVQCTVQCSPRNTRSAFALSDFPTSSTAPLSLSDPSRLRPDRVQAHSTLISITAAAVLALLLWRLWRFTITPALYPDDPKELPYWIPFLGE